MPQTARRNVPQSAPADLVEQAAALVRQSAAIDEARLDAFLDGAVIAAEQVQDTRLTVLEQPAELSATDLWVEIAIGLMIGFGAIGCEPIGCPSASRHCDWW